MLCTADALAQSHLRFGWWSLLVFLLLGAVLESLLALNVGWYMPETRRLMWRLAHAHGTLLGVVHLAFGMTLGLLPAAGGGRWRVASPLLKVSGLLLPLGFFLGGVQFYDGDPGLGILPAPIGAVLLVVTVVLIALGVTRAAARATT